MLSEGIGGRCFKGFYHDVAVVVKLPKSAEISGQEWREWQAHLKLPPHPHLVHFIGSLFREDTNFLVTKLIAQGSLKNVLQREETHQLYSTPFAVLRCALEIGQGLAHLHQHKIVHRDISSRNILVDSNGTMVIADLGLCREMSSRHGHGHNDDSDGDVLDNDQMNDEAHDPSYEMGRPTALPARWTSPEFINNICL